MSVRERDDFKIKASEDKYYMVHFIHLEIYCAFKYFLIT